MNQSYINSLLVFEIYENMKFIYLIKNITLTNFQKSLFTIKIDEIFIKSIKF